MKNWTMKIMTWPENNISGFYPFCYLIKMLKVTHETKMHIVFFCLLKAILVLGEYRATFPAIFQNIIWKKKIRSNDSISASPAMNVWLALCADCCVLTYTQKCNNPHPRIFHVCMLGKLQGQWPKQGIIKSYWSQWESS